MTTPLRLARSAFCVLIAPTTPTAWPATTVSPTATSVAWPRSEGKRNWHVLPAHVGRKQIGAESGGGLPQETVDGYEPSTFIAWQAITSPGRVCH